MGNPQGPFALVTHASKACFSPYIFDPLEKMSVRAKVNTYGQDGSKKGSVDMPAVFSVMHRPDIVEAVVQKSYLNTRTPYAVSEYAGYQTSASSWGTGRAVARVPRVAGVGSHRSGQAAFANFCRGGGMFAPTRTYRKWTRQTNQTERRHAQAFALSAAGCTSLVMARGHKVEKVPEIPLVVTNDLNEVCKTMKVKEFLANLGLSEDIERCVDNKKIRAGKGKNRNRKYKKARGPCIVYSNAEGLELSPVGRAIKGLEGVDAMSVDRLNIKQLAPGGKAGRLLVFTQAAFEKLNEIFGDASGKSLVKNGYFLPRSVVSGSVNKIIASEQVQSVIRAPMVTPLGGRKAKVNPFRNKKAMATITPKFDEITAVGARKMK